MPTGFFLNLYFGQYRKYAREFTIFVLGRRAGMPAAYSTRDMAADCAAAIQTDIGAPVDVVGESYGGLLAPYVAADYPGLVDHLVFASAAYRVSEPGKAVDRRFAELQSQGRWGAAYAVEVGGMYPRGIAHYVLPPVARLFLLGKRGRPANPSDLLVEAEAEVQHDCRHILKDIKAPTLVIAGDTDFFFPVELLRETAAGIPNAKLVLLPGKGHGAVATAPFGREVIAFLKQRKTVA